MLRAAEPAVNGVLNLVQDIASSRRWTRHPPIPRAVLEGSAVIDGIAPRRPNELATTCVAEAGFRTFFRPLEFRRSAPGHSPAMLTSLLRGAAAGAAGTTALNATTYVDMLLRGRDPSSTPDESVEKLAGLAHLSIPGTKPQRANRIQAAGSVLGIVTGVGVGMAAGAARSLGWRPSKPVGTVVTGIAAMVGAAAPMAVLGVSDPRRWSAADWLSDVVPHLVYGAVTTATLQSEAG